MRSRQIALTLIAIAASFLTLAACSADQAPDRQQTSTPTPSAIAALEAPDSEGTVLRRMTSADTTIDVSPLDAKGQGLFTAINCIGKGEVTIAIDGVSSSTMPCVANKVSQYMNHIDIAQYTFSSSVTATEGVVWGLTISRPPVVPVPDSPSQGG